MSIVNGFVLPGQDQLVRLSGPNSVEVNWVTAFIGDNGTKKSRILRQIAMAALTERPDRAVGLGESRPITTLNREPTRVLAVSATATDRLPLSARPNESRRSPMIDSLSYHYIGPRSATNIVSRRHTLWELVVALLDGLWISERRGAFLRSVLAEVGVGSLMEVRFRKRAPAASKGKPASLKDFIGLLKSEEGMLGSPSYRPSKRVVSALKKAEASQAEALIMSVDEFFGMHRDASWPPRLGGIGNREIGMKFDLASELMLSDAGLEPSAIALAVDLGYLVPVAAQFDALDFEDLSAGQWAALSSVIGVALLSRNDSLILVDEPENGLHPEWQRRYIGWLTKAISNRTGCQVLIATHSPFVVGSIPYDHSEVVRLWREQDSQTVNFESSKAPTGWDTNKILTSTFGLSSTRSPLLTEYIERALSIVARGSAIAQQDELVLLVESANAEAVGLRADDPLRKVLDSLVRIVHEVNA